MRCIEITLAITDSRYYGIADTSCGPQQTFLLFYSRYNGHLGRIFFAHTMKVSGFLIHTVTYFTVFIYQRVLSSFRASSFLSTKLTNRKIFKIVPLFSRFIRTTFEFFNVFCCFNVLAILALSSSLCRTRYSFLFGSQGLSSHITAHNKFIKSCQISLFTIQFVKNVTLPSR